MKNIRLKLHKKISIYKAMPKHGENAVQRWEKLVRFLDKFDHSMHLHLHQTSELNKLYIF